MVIFLQLRGGRSPGIDSNIKVSMQKSVIVGDTCQEMDI